MSLKMNIKRINITVTLLLISVHVPAIAHQHEAGVVPSSEKAIAQDLGVEGPIESKGIGEIKVLGMMPLDGELGETKGLVMRVREITLLPGGRVAVHQHTARPGAAYVVEGDLVEHRNDTEGPLLRGAGDVALEKTGVIHWWENTSSKSAKVVVVDIIASED